MKYLYAFALLSFCEVAAAQELSTYFYTGNKILEMCDSGHDLACTMYVAGAMDNWKVRGRCFTERPNMTAGQVSDSFFAYLKNNPDMRDMPAALALNSMMLEKYCPVR